MQHTFIVGSGLFGLLMGRVVQFGRVFGLLIAGVCAGVCCFDMLQTCRNTLFTNYAPILTHLHTFVCAFVHICVHICVHFVH